MFSISLLPKLENFHTLERLYNVKIKENCEYSANFQTNKKSDSCLSFN